MYFSNVLRLVFLFCILLPVACTAQRNTQSSLQSGIYFGESGICNQTLFNQSFNRHQFSIGGQITLQQSYSNSNQIAGPMAAWQFTLFYIEDVKAFAGVNCQTLIFKPDFIEAKSKFNSIVEINIVQGLEYKFSKHFAIGEWMGLGRFAENYYNPRTNRTELVNGNSFGGSVYLQYRF